MVGDEMGLESESPGAGGVLAPHSEWRPLIVPPPPPAVIAAPADVAELGCHRKMEDSEKSATRKGWSERSEGCDELMKFGMSSSGCETRPAKG